MTYLIAHDSLCFLVIQHRHRKSTRVIRVIGEVNFSDMRVFRMQRVRGDIFPRQFLIRSHEAPAFLTSESPPTHKPLPKCQSLPLSPKYQCTEVNEMKSSRPLSFRVINVRCAIRYISRLLYDLPSLIKRIKTYPTDTHTKHRDDNGPSPEGTARQSP